MKIITYATHEKHYYLNMLESAKKFNYDVTILGYGTEWKGFRDKPLNLYKNLKKIKDQENYIIFIDAFDVLFCKDSDRLLEDFKNNYDENSIVFNGEALSNSYYVNNKWLKDYKPKNVDKKNKYSYLNSGVYIGKIKNIIVMLKNLLDKGIENDQKAVMDLYNRKKFNISIDKKCHLFSTFSSMNNDLVFKNNKIFNKHTNTYPYIIHGPGPYTRLEPYIKYLGFKPKYEKSIATDYYYRFLCYTADFLILIFVFLIIYFSSKLFNQFTLL